MIISDNSSFSSPDDSIKINNIEKNTNLENLDDIPIVYQVGNIYSNIKVHLVSFMYIQENC